MSRRDEIIQAALTLVNEDGADVMSVRTVAARAGIGASTLRYYFPTYRDLVNAVADAATVQTLGDLNIHDSKLSARTRLAECLYQFLPQTEAQLPVLKTLVSVYASCFSDGKLIGSPQLTNIGRTSRERVESWLTTLASEGHSLTLPTGDLARLLISYINGLAIDLIVEAPNFNIENAQNEILKMVTLALPEDRPSPI